MKTEEKIAIQIKEVIEPSFDFKTKIEIKNFHELNGNSFTLNGFIQVPSELNYEQRDIRKNLFIVNSIHFNCLINTNHAGVSGPEDIERTITVNFTFNGKEKLYRKHHFNETTFNKFHKYYRIGDDKDFSKVISNMSNDVNHFYHYVLKDFEKDCNRIFF